MVRESKASDPSKPFLLYFSHGAVHAPLHAKDDDIDRHDGAYDVGWDVDPRAPSRPTARARRHPRRARRSPPRNTEPGDEVPAWEDLDPDRQRLYARYMEVYAAMVDNIDQNVGRLRAALEEMGEWDNTLFVFTSDNGGSREGEAEGTTAYLRTLHFGRVGRRGAGRGGPVAHRRDRRTDDDAALPPGVGDGVEHAVPAVQDQHPPGRPLGAARRVLARGRRAGR